MQEAMRSLFERWGRPERIRVDNGFPWATPADLPPALALWWVGLGIVPVYNPPRRPQKNPFVERSNGLVQQWGEPQRCPDYPAWEQTLTWVATTQREQYPAKGGQPRRVAHPELAGNPRPYRRAAERASFDLERVKRYLAEGRWPRFVSKIGQVTLYGKAYHVGQAWARQQVWVRLDPATSEWVIEASDGEELRRHPAAQLTGERILALNVAQPRPPKKKRHNSMAQPPSQLCAA